MLANLKSGDKVVTSSGIVGVVITVKDKTVSLRSADAKMEVTKPSVTDILESSNSARARMFVKVVFLFSARRENSRIKSREVGGYVS